MKTWTTTLALFFLMVLAEGGRLTAEDIKNLSTIATTQTNEDSEKKETNMTTALSTHVGEARGAVQDVEEPYYGYDAFLINEYSFKFWSVLQVISALLLIYASVLGVYYSKFTFSDEDFYPPFFIDKKRGERSITPTTSFKTIMDSISSDKYS